MLGNPLPLERWALERWALERWALERWALGRWQGTLAGDARPAVAK